jgi:tRNA/rRNA methyltransferase
MLQCVDGLYYVGHTDNIEKRFAEHQSGSNVGFTFFRLPVKLVFLQSFQTRDEAFQAERKIKTWSRNKKEALINGNWNEIVEWSKKKK